MQAGTDCELAAALAMSLDRPVDDAHAAEADSFSQMTGASPDKAAMWLAAHQGDVEAAVNAFFESGEDLPMPAPEAPLPRAQQIQAIRQGLVGGRWKCGSCTFVHEELEKQLLWCRVCHKDRVGPDVDLTTATPPFAMGDLTRVAELVSDLDEPEPEPPQNAGAGAAAAKEPDGEDDDGEAAMDWNMAEFCGGAIGGHGGSGGLAMDLKSFYREFCEPPPSLKSSCCAVILSTLRLQLTAGMWCANALGKPPFGSGSAKIPKQILAFADPNVPQPHSPTAQPAAKPSASCLLCVPCACVVSAR